MVRKKMTTKDVGNFKVKKKQTDRRMEETLDTVTSTVKARQDYTDSKNVSGGALRGMVEETMARVYEEMWPSMTTRDGADNVDIEIREEAYILGLTMVVGTEDFKPRKPLKIRDHWQKLPGYCKLHREAA